MTNTNPKLNMRGENHSGPDSLGRCVFTLFWLANYHPGDPRGEYRLAVPAKYEDVNWS